MSKDRWFDALRRRLFVSMHNLTDDEIKSGIEELENGILQGQQRVILPDMMNFICAWK